MRKKIVLEYLLSTSVKVLYSRLVTPSGLSEWFADDVQQKDNQFTFIWNAQPHTAQLVASKPNIMARFQWDDRGDDEEYFEFAIEVEPLTLDIALFITDFVDEDEEEDSIDLWNKQVEELLHKLGR